MKQTFILIRFIPVIIALAISGAFMSCNGNNSANNNGANDTTVSGKMKEMGNDIKATTDTVVKKVENAFTDNNPDSSFLTKATISNIKEIEMLKAGMDKGTSKMLKSDAKMMRADHMKLGETVKKYAAKINFQLPTTDEGKADNDLSKISDKSANDRDKAWVDDMIDDHKDAISTFEKYEDKVKDPDLKMLITNTLPTLHAHLDMVQKLKDKL